MEVAWQAHFVKNMFIRPTDAELENFGEPDFVVMNGSKTSFKAVSYTHLDVYKRQLLLYKLGLRVIGFTYDS